jgi:hypothetical protein
VYEHGRGQTVTSSCLAAGPARGGGHARVHTRSCPQRTLPALFHPSPWLVPATTSIGWPGHRLLLGRCRCHRPRAGAGGCPCLEIGVRLAQHWSTPVGNLGGARRNLEVIAHMPTTLPRQSVTLTTTLDEKVRAAAEAEGISVSQWLGRAARQRLALASPDPAPSLPAVSADTGTRIASDAEGAAPNAAGTAPIGGDGLPRRAFKHHRDRRRKQSCP